MYLVLYALCFAVSNQDEEAIKVRTEWRRFKPLKEDLSELENLIDKKGLTREDLKVILTSIELSEMGKAMIADGKGF